MNVQVFLFLLFKLKCFFDKIKHWYLSHTCRSLSRIHIEIAAFFASFGTVVIIYKRMIYINHSAFHIYIAPSQACYLADTQSRSYHNRKNGIPMLVNRMCFKVIKEQILLRSCQSSTLL